MSILDNYYNTIPKVFKPRLNRVLNAIIVALAASDKNVAEQLGLARDQLFIKSASGNYLLNLANSLGVTRPELIGISDEKFRELIPNLSLKPKQIKKAFYDVAEVFWGPTYICANATSVNIGPFNIFADETIILSVDNGAVKTIKFEASDIAIPGSATAEEIVAVLNRYTKIEATVINSILLGGKQVNIRTLTRGSVGNINILGGTALGSGKLDFQIREYDILDSENRVSIYNINPNELIIELPITMPALERQLEGSHHFHADSTIDPDWPGSFLYSQNGTGGSFTLTSQSAVLQQSIQAGEVVTTIQVDDVSNFVDTSGFLCINFGSQLSEAQVPYVSVNEVDNTIIIDPTYIFTQNHSSGVIINVIKGQTSYEPRTDGSDLAIYFTSVSGAISTVQEILLRLEAAGIILKFQILMPDYKYLIINPYTP